MSDQISLPTELIAKLLRENPKDYESFPPIVFKKLYGCGLLVMKEDVSALAAIFPDLSLHKDGDSQVILRFICIYLRRNQNYFISIIIIYI